MPRVTGLTRTRLRPAVTAKEAGAKVREMRPEETAAVAGWHYDGP